MRRILIILLVCCAYAGCARPVPETVPFPAEEAAPVAPAPEHKTAEPSPPTDQERSIRVLAGSDLRPEQVIYQTAGSAYAGGVELIDDGGDPALMLRLGEADVAVLLGKQIGQVERQASEDYLLERFAARDRTYFLLITPDARWVNDPTFRRWLAGLFDRERMLDYLFDGRGEAAYSFTPGRSDGPVWERQDARPLASDSEPRLALRFDERDSAAATMASRIKAELEVEGVHLSFAPLSEESVSMFLWAQMPADVETLSPLRAAVERIRDHAAGELGLLERATMHDRQEVRDELAWWAESSLIRDGRMIPLLRLEAWLARRPALQGVGSGAGGELVLDEAWWSP